ncbi:unnamed protein product [Heterosigma akashiwo]
MVVRLRLQRFGRKDRPFYRVVAADSRSPRDGKFLEIVGTYNPITSKEGVKEVRLNGEKVRYWLSVGAQPSKRVEWLLGGFGLLPAPPQRPFGQSSVPKKERQGASFSTLALPSTHMFAAAATGSVPTSTLGCLYNSLNTNGLKIFWNRIGR